ncbi:hypothetical protein B0H11DRAFT_1919078 [Mycena galericulata]|nr:hypothetical protein B0H11DRAFT_1919078 [Mycena galericulata]
MSMSQSIISDPGPSLEAQLQGFPAAWFSRADDTYIIDNAHWNTEAAPAHEQLRGHYSVDWPLFYGLYLLNRAAYQIEIAGLVVRHYFGIQGCIIPVGFIPQIAAEIFAFTLAGPCDADGRKEFYFLFFESCLPTAKLWQYSPGFRSVAAFHVHHNSIKATSVPLVEGGEEEVKALFVKCGIEAEPVEEVESLDWSL